MTHYLQPRLQPAPATPPVGGLPLDTCGCPTHWHALDLSGARVPGCEIASDGRTVWVNEVGTCIARFSPGGYEVGGPLVGTLFSSNYGALTPADWSNFQSLVWHYFGISLAHSLPTP